MPPNETWKVALGALSAHKLRAFLSMVGVVIGSASIVLMVTVMLTGKHYVMGQIEAVGSNLVFAEMPLNPSVPTALSDEITPADMQAVRQAIPQVVEVAGTYDTPMTMVVGGVEHPVTLIGVTEGFQRIRNLLVLRGRYFDPHDMDTRSKVCLVTQDLAERFLPDEDPVGKNIRVGELTFSVIGAFRERVATFGESEIAQDSVIIPFPLMKYYAGGRDIIRTLYAQADRPENVPGVTRQVEEILESRHRAGAQYHV
jgi:putative ABC transport system permease protein